MFFSNNTGEKGATIYFSSDTHDLQYDLSVRQGELLRRLLNNIEILNSSHVLMDILAALTPFSADTDSCKQFQIIS